ncbi:S8 family peptidase [Thalassobellus citreus]|uniref:S8 family peptidase n=1 Tax=Thalassobellus citreus TaxID=3367752 RepID=UPI0037A1D019
MKKYRIIIISFLLVFYACQKEEFIKQENTLFQGEIFSKEEINKKILDIFIEKGKVDWSDLNEEELWSAVKLSENNLITVLLNFESNNDAEKKEIIDFIVTSEKKPIKDVVFEINDNLKYLTVKILKKETFLELMKMEKVEFIEPEYSMYTEEEYASFETEPIRKLSDIKFLQKTPYLKGVFNSHNISYAWEEGLSGEKVKIAIIDNGMVREDKLFGENGDPNGDNSHSRTFEKTGTYKRKWWKSNAKYDGNWAIKKNSTYRHGTNMATIAAGPSGKSTTGIAYNADLISVRSSNYVFIDWPPNKKGVIKAFEYLSTVSSVKIISMSQGGIIGSRAMSRAIDKCHQKGKLIFCAAGTFPKIGNLIGDWLTCFPARYKNTYSVTGVTNSENLNNADWCRSCFGVADFVVEFWGHKGSSSESTSSTAGMAALIWSENPSLTGAAVINKMISGADNQYKSYPFGYGRVDMAKIYPEKLKEQ